MLHEIRPDREVTEQLAYRLWQEAGCPEGQADRFWTEAQDRLAAAEGPRDVESAPSAPASFVPPDVRPGPLPVVSPAIAALPVAAPAVVAPPVMAPPAEAPPVAPQPEPDQRTGLARYFAEWWAYPAKPGQR